MLIFYLTLISIVMENMKIFEKTCDIYHFERKLKKDWDYLTIRNELHLFVIGQV